MKDAIEYIVTVKAVTERVEKGGKKWERINATPDSEYGYTPEIDVTVKREVQIYEQRVTELDMVSLVSAVNKLARG